MCGGYVSDRQGVGSSVRSRRKPRSIDMFQTDTHVVVSIFAKVIDPSSIKLAVSDDSVRRCPNPCIRSPMSNPNLCRVESTLSLISPTARVRNAMIALCVWLATVSAHAAAALRHTVQLTLKMLFEKTNAANIDLLLFGVSMPPGPACRLASS